MSHGDSTAQDGAAARLRHLNAYFREHPVTGPTEGRAPTRTPAAPLNLATLDHIHASVTEVIDHTRTANPAAGPAPTQTDAIYDWARRHTQHSEETIQQRTEVIEYRHYLAHALRAGDRTVIRRQRCPECRTWGLMWQDAMQAALCTNLRCVDRDGTSTTVDLDRLAHEHVAARKSRRDVRAT